MSIGNSGVDIDEVIEATDVPFDNTGIKFSQTNVQDAIEDLRDKDIQSVEVHTTTLNGTDVLTVSSTTIHVAEGSATGYKFDLPDATTLFVGRRFQLINNTSETVLVRDDAGTTLATLISGDSATAVLEDNGSAAGSWITTIITSAASGITSYVLETSTAFNTSSTTDVVITGFTVTPVTGRYGVWFSADIDITQNNRLATCTIYQGGSPVTDTLRTTQGVSSNFNAAFQSIGEVTVNGSQAVDVRVTINAGALIVNGRTLLLIRLGA
jgi:hypothetical protein